jgi:hypothetical protein
MTGLPSTSRSRVLFALTETADQVRDALDLPGLLLVVQDLAERKTTTHVGRPPYRKVILELTECQRILYRLGPPRDDRMARWLCAALLSRDLAPIRAQDDWSLLTPRISWALARLGCPVESAVEIADACSQEDGMEE